MRSWARMLGISLKYIGKMRMFIYDLIHPRTRASQVEDGIITSSPPPVMPVLEVDKLIPPTPTESGCQPHESDQDEPGRYLPGALIFALRNGVNWPAIVVNDTGINYYHKF